MIKATVLRQEYGDNQIIGTLFLDDEIQCYTLELPWRQNQEDVSCIPEGYYTARRGLSSSHGEVFWMQDVPKRTNIIFGHVGNTCKDTTGCILLGQGLGRFRFRRGVTNSRRASEAFHRAVKAENVLQVAILSVRP